MQIKSKPFCTSKKKTQQKCISAAQKNVYKLIVTAYHFAKDISWAKFKPNPRQQTTI